MRITEEMAKKIADTLLKIDLIEVSRETQEEQFRDSVSIDISSMLY